MAYYSWIRGTQNSWCDTTPNKSGLPAHESEIAEGIFKIDHEVI